MNYKALTRSLIGIQVINQVLLKKCAAIHIFFFSFPHSRREKALSASLKKRQQFFPFWKGFIKATVRYTVNITV